MSFSTSACASDPDGTCHRIRQHLQKHRQTSGRRRLLQEMDGTSTLQNLGGRSEQEIWVGVEVVPARLSSTPAPPRVPWLDRRHLVPAAARLWPLELDIFSTSYFVDLGAAPRSCSILHVIGPGTRAVRAGRQGRTVEGGAAVWVAWQE